METGLRQNISAQLSTSPSRRVDSGVASSSPVSSSSASNNKTTTTQEDAAARREHDRIVQELEARDREVRAHEAAHLAVGGRYVISGPSYTYQQGPDGHSYAVGGEVELDISAEAKPEATLDKAETVGRAALAPVDPSIQDRMVASRADQLATQARLEIARENREMMQADQQSARSEKSRQIQVFEENSRADAVQQVNVYA